MRVSISLEKTLTSRAAAVQIHQIARPFSSFVSTICTTVSYICNTYSIQDTRASTTNNKIEKWNESIDGNIRYVCVYSLALNIHERRSHG